MKFLQPKEQDEEKKADNILLGKLGDKLNNLVNMFDDDDERDIKRK